MVPINGNIQEIYKEHNQGRFTGILKSSIQISTVHVNPVVTLAKQNSMFDVHIIILLSNGGQKDSSPHFYISPVWGTTNGTFK